MENWLTRIADKILSKKTMNEEKHLDSNGDLVPLVWLIEKLRRREGGCTMNELVATVKKEFKGIDGIKHRTIKYNGK